MKFDTILMYQDIDRELINIENDVAKSKERAAFMNAKAKLEAATAAVGKLSHEAAELLAGYGKLSSRAEELKAKLDEVDGLLDDIADVNEADYYIKQIDAVNAEIASLERDAGRDAERAAAIGAEYKRTWDAGRKASEAYKEATAAFNEVAAKVQPRMAELKAKLKEIEPSVPAEFMAAYKSLRAAKKTPAFVAYKPESGTCGRCFMEVSGATKGKLKNPGDHAECPNCRRILYIPE